MESMHLPGPARAPILAGPGKSGRAHPALSVLASQRIATEAFTDADTAVARLEEIYERNTCFLRDSLRNLC
jgi:hypothetical protein